MKSKLVILIVLIIACINGIGQSINHHGSDNRSSSFIKNHSGKNVESFMRHSKNIETYWNPVLETDSIYTIGIGWAYEWDGFHTYYSATCWDSVDTYTIHGVNDHKITYQYDWRGNCTYSLYQTWNGGNWVNNSLFLVGFEPNGCDFQYWYNLSWNGASWDTLDYSNRLINYSVDGNGNVIEITAQLYIYNMWENDYMNILSYNTNNQLTGIDYYYWDSTANQFSLNGRDTNFNYFFYYGYCDYYANSYIELTWSGTDWQNSLESVATIGAGIDSIWTINWNGNAFTDTTQLEVDYNDTVHYTTQIYGGMSLYAYDSTTHAWDSILYYNVPVLTYGINSEVVRNLTITNQNSPNPDSIYPYMVAIYSDFIACMSTGINEVANIDKSVSVYPDPASTIIHFHLPTQSTNQLIITDLVGNVVYKETLSGIENDISLSTLVNGIYFYKIINEKETYQGKFIVQK